MNTRERQRRDALILAGGLVVISLVLFRCGADEPEARPARRATTTVAAPVPQATTTSVPPPAPGAPSTAGPTAPATPTEEAAARPPATPTEPVVSDVGRVAVGFLRAWATRGDVDTRRALLDDYATFDYAALTAITDPDRIGLPPGDRIEVTSTDLRGDLGATVYATLDGLPVRVDLTRTGTGYLVESHAPV